MRIIQTIETLWEIDEVALADRAELEYGWWIEEGNRRGDYVGFVKASVDELGTEVFGLRLVETETTFAFEESETTG